MAADPYREYYVAVYETVSQNGKPSSSRWGWVIKRHSADLGVAQKSGFLTEAGARLAGENVLKHPLRNSFNSKDVTG